MLLQRRGPILLKTDSWLPRAFGRVVGRALRVREPTPPVEVEPPAGQPVAITLLTSARGSIRLLCPMEDGAGVLLVR